MLDSVTESFSPSHQSFIPQNPPDGDDRLTRRRDAQMMLMTGSRRRRLGRPHSQSAPDRRWLMAEIVPKRGGWRKGYGPAVRLVMGTIPRSDQASIPFWVIGGRRPLTCGHRLVVPTPNSFIVRTGYARAYEPEEVFLSKLPNFLKDFCHIAKQLGVTLLASSTARSRTTWLRWLDSSPILLSGFVRRSSEASLASIICISGIGILPTAITSPVGQQGRVPPDW